MVSGKGYSIDEKRRVVQAYFLEGMNLKATSSRLMIPFSSTAAIIAAYLKTGEVSNPQTSSGRKRVVSGTA